MAEKISNAERVVMEVLWEKSPLSAQEVVETVALQKDMHEKTVKTLLNHLLKKKILGFDKEKRKYLYYPLLSRKAYVQFENKKFLENWFGDKVSHQLLVSFAGKGIIEQARDRGIEKIIR